MVELDTDVFAAILTYIHDTPTLYALFEVFPKSHPLLLVTLDRLWQLPVNLDSFDTQATEASNAVLDNLLTAPVGESEPLARHLRHLIVHLEHTSLESRTPSDPPADVLALRSRIADLLGLTSNLRSFDYRGFPGLRLDSTILGPLGGLGRLERFGVDCGRCSSSLGVPAACRSPSEPGGLSARFDAENWDIDTFTTTIGPRLSALELRHINFTMFAVLKSKIAEFKTYTQLRELTLDITEGVWDWDGGGSPAMGASSEFEFPFLGFPAVRRLELVVCDKTLYASQVGPLNMVDRTLLEELCLDLRSSIGWTDFEEIYLFEALSPLEMNALRLLEIKDNILNNQRNFWDSDEEDDDDEDGDDNDEAGDEDETAEDQNNQEEDKDNSLEEYNKWDRDGRVYPGLVTMFLASMGSGGLPNLTHLWVDERVLMPAELSIQEILSAYGDSLRGALSRLTSLRVGFGRVDAADVQDILDLCDPAKLTQFGFEWKWQAYGQDETISSQLLATLSHFPSLTDVHILFPRPGTETNERATTDPRTLSDVAALFVCNTAITTVGIGHSIIWDRASPPLLVCNGKHGLPNAYVPRFFQAGFMLNGMDGPAPEPNNSVPKRPKLGEEIEQLRNVLQNVFS